MVKKDWKTTLLPLPDLTFATEVQEEEEEKRRKEKKNKIEIFAFDFLDCKEK